MLVDLILTCFKSESSPPPKTIRTLTVLGQCSYGFVGRKLGVEAPEGDDRADSSGNGGSTHHASYYKQQRQTLLVVLSSEQKFAFKVIR